MHSFSFFRWVKPTSLASSSSVKVLTPNGCLEMPDFPKPPRLLLFLSAGFSFATTKKSHALHGKSTKTLRAFASGSNHIRLNPAVSCVFHAVCMVSLSYFSVNAPNAGKKKLLTSHLFFEELQRHQETSHMMNHPKMKNEYIFALLHDKQTSQGFDMCTFFVQLPALGFSRNLDTNSSSSCSKNQAGTIFRSPPFGTLFDGYRDRKILKSVGTLFDGQKTR